jgi:uncharacterized paraquat-inducible protein A
MKPPGDPAYSAIMLKCPACGVDFRKPSVSKIIAVRGLECPNCKAKLKNTFPYPKSRVVVALMLLVAVSINLTQWILGNPLSHTVSDVTLVLILANSLLGAWASYNSRLNLKDPLESPILRNLNHPRP